MTLFIGVVTTSMEEAQNKQEEEEKCAIEAEKVRKKADIPRKTMAIYRTVFDQLDVDCGGTEEEELRLGLLSINQSELKPEEKDFFKLLLAAQHIKDKESEDTLENDPRVQKALDDFRLLVNCATGRLVDQAISAVANEAPARLEPLFFAEFCMLVQNLNIARDTVLVGQMADTSGPPSTMGGESKAGPSQKETLEMPLPDADKQQNEVSEAK